MATRFGSAPFRVIYWSGGSEVGRWCEILTPFPSREAARVEAVAIERAGRPCYIKSQAELDVIGLPEGAPPGWDFSRLEWRNVRRAT